MALDISRKNNKKDYVSIDVDMHTILMMVAEQNGLKSILMLRDYYKDVEISSVGLNSLREELLQLKNGLNQNILHECLEKIKNDGKTIENDGANVLQKYFVLIDNIIMIIDQAITSNDSIVTIAD